MGNGKIGIAPCGHQGEAVVGQYYHCLEGCDDVDFRIEIDTPVIVEQCPKCQSINTEPYGVDPLYYLYNPGLAIITCHCINCGACW